MRRTGLFFIIVSVLAISILSCDVEIGLGASVDTRAPELTIQNPPIGSVIRDVFALSGTCGDDGTIKSVTVDIKQAEDSTLSYSIEGTFDQKEGTWSCEINPLNEKMPIPDGAYEATVTIKDGAERETIRTRQFTIDNTAPVLAITRPSSVIPTGSDLEKYSATDYDSYGQDFVIEGHVADTCERRYISVDIYDLKGELKYSTLNAADDSQKRIKIDSDFSTTIASFGDAAYTAIYGDDDEAGTQKYFCKITVYDNARKYPVDSNTLVPEDLVGNSAEYFYMYEGDLYNSIFDTYGMTNAYRLLNGSFSEDDSRNLNTTVSPEQAKKDLENPVYQETMGFLSLNPKNNPYFKVSGHEALDKDEMENGTVFEDDNNKITNNSTVVVEVYPGLDQTPLIQDNLGLYLLQADFKGNPIDSNGNVVKADEAEKLWLVRPLTDKDGTAILSSEDDAEEIEARKSLISKIGSTYKFTVYLTTKEPTANGKELKANNYYLFGVQGWDKKAVPVKNADTVLGFMLVESGTAPSLTIKTITPEWITTNVNTADAPNLVDENAVKTFSVEMAFAGDAPYRLSRTVNDGEPVEVLKISDDHRLAEYTDKYTPEAGAVSGTIKYILTGSNNLTSTKETSFKVDNERPIVGEIEVPSVNVTEKSSFTFKGTVSAGDAAVNSEIADVQMKLSYVAGETTVDSGWISVGNTGNWDHTVVFQEDEELKTIFAKEGLKKIEVRTIDKAGNISEVKQSSFVYDTGRPELTVQTYKMDNNAAQQIKSEFFISESFSISGKATDTYGIDTESLKLTQVKGTGDDAVTLEIPITTINDKGEWTVGNLPRNTQAGSIDQALVATDDYTFTISVTDLTGVKKETSTAYKVSIDLDAPVVAITSPSAGEIVSGDTTRITGSLNDGNGTGISGYSYKFVKAGETAANVAWTSVTTKAENFSFYKDLVSGNTIAANSTALCEGSWSLHLKAVDEAGNECDEVVQNFKVDMNDPALTSAITTSSTCISQTGLYYFKGNLSGTASATDTNEPERIVIEYKLGSEIIQPTINGSIWTIPASSFTADTPTTLTITAYDAVGNQSKKEYQVYYDVTAPSVNVAASALQNGAVVNSFPLTIYGTADDGTGIGATSIYYSLDGSEPVTELVAASSSWTKEITGTGLTEGSKALKLKIKDSLNNESAVTTINFSYDRSDPTLTETGIGESGATVNAGITLQGTTGDTNGIDSIEITDSANEDSRWTIARSEMTESGSSLTWSKSIALGTEANTLEDGRHNFTIIAKDLAGKQTKLTRSVVVDTTAPEILTITTPATDDEATGTNSISNATYKFIGTAQDSGSGIASYSYSFTHSSTAPATGWTTVNTGNGEWEITKTLTAASETNCLEQGEWYLFVKATDKAGNTVAAPVSRHFWIDMGAPSVTDVNIAGGTYYFSTDALTITGKSIDTHGLKQTGAVVIKKTAEGETAADETLASINASAVGTNGAWSAAIAADAIPSDGTPVTITIEATDIVGRTSGVNTYTVCKDMVAPVVTASPVSNAAMAYQNGVNIQFTGTASDTNLDEVKAELYKNNEATPASTTTLSPDRTTGAWTWKVYDLDQASYKLKVTAKDKAGNTSAYTTGSITIDTTAPKTTVNGTALYKADGTAAESTLSDGTVEEIEKKYAQSSYTLSGTITDANFESIVLKENGTTKTVNVDGTNWTYTPAAFTTGTEVTNNYTITVKDKANNITSYSLTVVYDTKAPVIEITSPEATYYPTVPDANGTVRDSGIGITEVKYSTDGNTWSDTGWTSGMSWSVDIGTMVTEEGSVTLYLKAKDKFGNESNPPVSVSFSYDSAAPSLVETDETTGPTGNDTSFTLSGKAWDSNGLSRIEIFDQNTNKTYTYKISGTTDTTPLNDEWITGSFISLTAAQSSPANDNWSATFVVGNDNSNAANYFADGTHQLVIKAYDVAQTGPNTIGRASTAIYKSVFVDLNDPVVEITTPSAAASTNQTTYLFRGTIQEANLDKATLWVYRVKQDTETEDVRISNAAGETLAPSYNSGTQKYDWSYTGFDFENDKEYYVKVTAKDLAGREHTVTSNGVSVDNQAPTTTLTGSGLYASGASGLTSVTSLTNQETYYARSAYTLGGTVTENKAMGSVQVKVDNNATDTLTLSSNAWTKTGVTTDGNHKYAITVKDAAGNSSMYSINVVYDATNPEVLSATVPTTSSTEGVSYKFTGTAQDSGSGLKKIEVQIVNNGANPSETGWTEALGLTSWNSTIVFSEYNVFSTEGIKTLCVRATDEVGNVSEVFTKNFVYDKAYPTLAVSTYTPEGGSALTISSTDNEPIFNVNGNFALSGSASDTNGIKQVVITQKIGDSEPVVIETLNAAGATTFNWSTNTGTGKGLPRNPTTNVASTGNALTSGIYTYTVTVTDVAGNESITEATTKTTTKTVKASIDKTAPTISITTPASNSSNTGLSAISDVSFRFAGTAGDSGEGATGVEKVWYKIVAQNDDVPSAPSSDTAVDSSWTAAGFHLASNTTSWFFTQAMNAGTTASDSDHICEGNYKLAVYAVDMAGNVSSLASQIFDVDMSAPEIVTVLDTTTLEESMTQTKTGTYTFKYKVTETYGLAANNPVVTMKKDNADFTGFTQSAADANGYVTVSIASQEDGLYEYTIAATDKVGKNSTIRRNILLDTTPPALTVTSPDLSGYQNSTNVKVIGSAEDKTGTKAVWYAFGTASMPAVPANNTTADASWTGNSWTKATGTTSWSFTVTGVEGTDKNLYIAAVDENGAVTTSFKLSSSAADTVSSAIIKVDATNPTLTETGIGAGTQYKNAAFTLSGTASDTGSGLVTTNPVTITDGTNTYHPTVTAGAWSQEIEPASDGTYTYTIKVTDNAGRDSSLSRTVVYDTTAPTVGTKAIGTVGTGLKQTIGGVDWYKTTQIPVTISGSDATAGVKVIECSTDNLSWNTLSKNGDNYTGTISCTTQGENTIYIRVTDNAGNMNTPANDTLTVNVDTTAPDTFELDKVAGETLEGIKLINGRADLAFTVTASDAANGSGLASTGAVALKQIGTVVLDSPIAATGPVSSVYTITIPQTKMPSVTTPVNVIVTVKDGLGNSADFTAFQMQKDNKYPKAEVGTIDDANKSTTVIEVNGIITVSGTASDEHTLSEIALEYSTNGGTSWTAWTGVAEQGSTPYNWSYKINTRQAPFASLNESTVMFRALATDEAGNTGNSGTTAQYAANNGYTQTVKISQYTDRPVIRFTNLNLGTSTIWLKNTNTIYGLISDDDGDVTSLLYRLSTDFEEDNTTPKWTTLTPTSGSGYFEITNIADGQSTLYFQVEDAAGKTFATDTAATPDTLNEPILSDGTNKKDGLTGSATVELTLKVDKTTPMVQNKLYQIFNTEQGTNGQWGNWITENNVKTWSENAWSDSLITLGGRYTGLKVKLEAKDDNAIASVTSTFGTGNTVSFTCGEDHDDNAYHPWSTGEITIPNNVTEVRNLSVVITDGAGLYTDVTIPVEIDNSAPVIHIDDPSTLIGTTETIRGNISTATNSETRDVKLYYAVSRYNATADNVKPADSGTRMDGTTVLATAWTPIESVTTSLNWYVYFDDAENLEDHTDRFAIYLTEGTQEKPYLGITTEAAIENGNYETETQLYFWLKAVDNSGNTSVAYKELLVDPQGDRPSVELSYPTNVEDSNHNSVAPTLGGSIRLNGTATDNRYAKYVWVQIEKPNAQGVFDGFDAADLAYMNTSSNGERTYGYDLGKISTNETQTIAQIASAVSANTNVSDYGIRVAVNGSSWFVIVNNQNEYSPAVNSNSTTQIKFTIIATDETTTANNGIKINKSQPITQIITLDSDTPYIDETALRLVQYANNDGTACTNGSVSSGTVVNELTYQNGMSIHGIWFLKGSITDDSGLSQIKINNTSRVESNDSGTGATADYNANGISLTHINHQGSTTVCDYDFQIKIGNDSDGEVGTDSVTIWAQEVKGTSPLYVEKTFSVTYDNLAPVFVTSSDNNNVSLSTEVLDSSGFFTFGAVATEDSVGEGQNAVKQSGVERIAFYFTRDLGYNIKTLSATQYSEHDTNKTVTHDLFDVMISSENKDSDDLTTGNIIIDYASGAVAASDTNPSAVFTPADEDAMKTGYKYEDHLIWQNVDNCTVNGAAITVPDDTNVKNIHKGGLVKIKGAIYKITSVSGNTFSIGENLTTSSTTMDAMFAIANVIDYAGEKMGSSTSTTKGYGYGYYSGNTQDDGDLMLETFTKQQDAWIFDASIKSTNLPDGPITLHIVAMDKAGNVSEYAYNATVRNNGPRIAGMYIGTDENGNGSVENSELNTTDYHGFYENGLQRNNKITNATFPAADQQTNGMTSAVKVKGTTKIVPEIIGGNNGLTYTYDVYYRNEGDTDWNTTAAYIVSNPTSLGTGVQNAGATINDAGITLDVADFVKPANEETESDTNPSRIKDGNKHKFVFHIGDTTPALSSSGTSQGATLNVIMNVALRDSTPAKNYILPFYWNSSSSNSLFNNSKDNGHIELAKDWVFASGYDGTTSGEYDNDPKVSGKIKLEGIAQDEGVLKEIKVQFDKSMGGLGTTDTIIATYNDGTYGNDVGKWGTVSGTGESQTFTPFGNDEPTEVPSSGWTSYVKQATYGDLFAVGIITAIPDDKEATNPVPETSQQYGHVVHWTLYLDTAYVANAAATDVVVTATATDKGKPTWSGSAVDYTSNTATVTGSGYSCAVTKNGNTPSESNPVIGSYTGQYRMDVVPYITGVETSITSFLSKDYTRSAVGDYPIKLTNGTGEIIKVSGFNLSPTNKDIDDDETKSDVRLSKNNIALSETTKIGTGLEVAAGTGTDAGKWLVTMSASGNGNLVFFTNGLPTLNNVDSEAEYNKESSLIHASLNNDRKFSLWNFTSLRTNNSAPKSNGATYPSMAMNNDTPQFAYVNNVEGYGLAEFWNGTTETKIYENWDLFTYTSLALNSEGKRAALYDINVVQEGSGYPSDSGGIMTNFFNNPPNTTWNGTTYYFRNNNVWMDGLYKEGVTAVLGRYQYPTIRMLGNNNISHVFYSVYDSLDDRVVFRYFTVGTSNSLISNATAITSENSKVYINKNQLNQVAVGGSWPNYTSTNNNNRRFSSNGSYAGTTTNPQAFATGQTVGLYTATAGVPTTEANGNVTAARGILVYYAGTNMYYTYATNDANTTWSDPVVLDSNCEASYISMVVDSAKYVHIAYQNNIAGDVKYIYIPTYSAPATRKAVTVDSYLTVGDKLTLDVIDSTPYIGYKGLGNTAKVAWYVANNGVPAVATLVDGIDSDEKFTGAWNVEIIPNRIVDSDTNRFNVGVGRTSKRPVIGYSNNQSGSKGIEYLTRTADLAE